MRSVRPGGPATDTTIGGSSTVDEPAANADASPGPPSPAITPGQDEDLIGQLLLGQYRILRNLGEGVFGTVYLAEQVRAGSLVPLRRAVVKVLRRQHLLSPQIVQRVEQEATVLAALHHQNLVALYASGVLTDGRPFLAMEYGGDTTLASVIEGGRLEIDRALAVSEQICDGLNEAHRHGIVHRDLKPANILLCGSASEEMVKIVDLGIAKLLENTAADGPTGHLTETGIFIGTPKYASPEQSMSDRLDGRSDLYSLGVVLFEMLTGELPIRASSGVKYLEAHVHQTPARPDELGVALPSAVTAILSRVLQKDPDTRFQTARELRQAISRARLELQQKAFVPVDAGGRPRRFRWWYLAPAVLAVVIGAVELPRRGPEAAPRPAPAPVTVPAKTPEMAPPPAPAPPAKLVLRTPLKGLRVAVDGAAAESDAPFVQLKRPEGELRLHDTGTGWAVVARYKRAGDGVELRVTSTTPALVVSVDRKPVSRDGAIAIGPENRKLVFAAGDQQLVVISKVERP